jgi:hypothetical protein
MKAETSQYEVVNFHGKSVAQCATRDAAVRAATFNNDTTSVQFALENGVPFFVNRNGHTEWL